MSRFLEDGLRCVNEHGAHIFAIPITKIYLLLLSATGVGLDASTAHEKEMSVTKVVQTTKNVSNLHCFLG